MHNNILDKIKGHPHIVEGTAYPILFAIGMCHLLNDMVQSVVPAVYPLLKDKFGFTFAQIGIITFVYQMTSSIFQPFVGQYADRHPQPYFMTLGMGFMILGIMMLAYASDFAIILLAVAIIGCGSSVFHPEASRVAQLASGGKKSLAQSIFQVGGNGGSSVGPLLAAMIVIPYGQHAIGWFVVAALIATVLLTRIGAWYSLLLSEVSVCNLPEKTVNMAMGILILMIFSRERHLPRFCGDSVPGGRQGDATWNAFAGKPCQVDGREMPPGTLSLENRGRWEAGKDTWNTFAGIPWQVDGKFIRYGTGQRNENENHGKSFTFRG